MIDLPGKNARHKRYDCKQNAHWALPSIAACLCCCAMSQAATTHTDCAVEEIKGTVGEVLPKLLAAGRTDAVMALFKQLEARNTDLLRRLAKALARNKKKEIVSSAQLRLFLEKLGAKGLEPGKDGQDQRDEADAALQRVAPAPPPKDKRKSKPRKQPLRRPFPASLERVFNTIEVSKGERNCQHCDKERPFIGYEVTEELDLKPAQLIVRVTQRESRGMCCNDGAVKRAPKADKIVSGGRYGITLVSQMFYDKYWDGLPLTRQEARFAKLGVEIPTSSLCDQIGWATDTLRPLWRAAQQAVLNAIIMHLDATSLLVLDKRGPNGTKLGSLWGYVGDAKTALYLYAPSGHATQAGRSSYLGPQDFLSKRTGYVVADAASVFDASFVRTALIECGCNMHGRRYFHKALDAGDTRAAYAIAAFHHLYRIEREIRCLSPPDKLTKRQRQSKPIYDQLIAWCLAYQPHEAPKSPLGRAIGYLLNQQLPLTRFLTDGRIPIDNGAVERLHVRAALTRKNYLFAGSDTGAERAAIAYTILGSCQLADVNPLQYLPDVLARLSGKIRLADMANLLPTNWKPRDN
jgi:transposase